MKRVISVEVVQMEHETDEEFLSLTAYDALGLGEVVYDVLQSFNDDGEMIEVPTPVTGFKVDNEEEASKRFDILLDARALFDDVEDF